MHRILLCALLAGCGFEGHPVGAATVDGPPGTPTPDASTALSASIFIERLITLQCGAAFACQAQYPSDAHDSFAVVWGADLDDCLATDRDYTARGEIESAVTAGTITFDAERAAACLAAPGIPTTCSALFADTYDWADSCYAALRGHVADGGACTSDWECARGSTCRGAKCSRS